MIRTLDLRRFRSLLRYPIVIDGRNLFEPENMRAHAFNYYSMGRPDVLSEYTLHDKTDERLNEAPRFGDSQSGMRHRLPAS